MASACVREASCCCWPRQALATSRPWLSAFSGLPSCSPPACLGREFISSADSTAMGRIPMDLSVVIPIKDERDNLRLLHEQLRQSLTPVGLDYEVIFVDDGSSDGSFAVLEGLASVDPRLK